MVVFLLVRIKTKNPRKTLGQANSGGRTRTPLGRSNRAQACSRARIRTPLGRPNGIGVSVT